MKSRRCSKCKTLLPLTEFAIDRSRQLGRKYICRDCDSKRVSPGPTLVERERMLVFGMKWCLGCLSWVPLAVWNNSRCRSCNSRRERERYSADPPYRAERRRHALLRARGVEPVPDIGREYLLEQFDGLCAYCQKPADTWDHIVPVTRGGKTVPGNIVPACRSCNSSKHNFDFDQFLDRAKHPHPALFDVLVLAPLD